MAQMLAMPVAALLSVICNGRSGSLLSNNLSLPVSNQPQYSHLSVQCVHVGGVEILNKKHVEFSLQYIHGIGRTKARQILCDLNLENKITKDLSDEELIFIRDEVSKYTIKGDLRRFNALAIRRFSATEACAIFRVAVQRATHE